jgi:serine/threonine-protein kinase HipA
VLVSRYDRKAEGGGIRRLHQIDLCQAMGLPPGKKYESEGGPSLKACFDAVAKHSAQPGPDKNRLIEWVVFNVLAGNMDSHAKNVSLLAADNGKTRLAPFYDMLCTTVYPNLSHKFALKIGGENRPQWMMARHWERFAEQIGTTGQFVAELQAKMAERVGLELAVVAASLRGRVSSQSDLAMIDRVEGEIRRAVATMKSRLGGQQPRVESDPGLIEKDCDNGEGCSPR